MSMNPAKTYDQLLAENARLLIQLEEATGTIEAIRTGQVDALVVEGANGLELYTLTTADQAYRVFIETMNEGAVTLNEAGLILYCNSAFAALVGLPLSNVMGLSFETFIATGGTEIYRELMTKGWLQTWKAEVLIQATHGTVPCQLSVTALELYEGVALSLILTDLSLQKQTQAQLKQNNERLADMNAALETSNYDLQQFASVASHDLQEPLRKILIYSNLLKDQHGREFPAGQGRYLDKIIGSSTRMKTIITDVLSYSRLSFHDSTRTITNLRVLVSEVLDDFELLIWEKKAVVTLGDLPELEVNPGQIRQVFQNLISNALKFSKPGQPPSINIECTSGPEAEAEPQATPSAVYCWITITDNGIGFDEQYTEKVFSLFHRLNTKDAYEGSGIGLAFAKRIIDKHGGTIGATSQEGVGSKFKIKLPLYQTTSN